jgi:hypothetical protein
MSNYQNVRHSFFCLRPLLPYFENVLVVNFSPVPVILYHHELLSLLAERSFAMPLFNIRQLAIGFIGIVMPRLYILQGVWATWILFSIRRGYLKKMQYYYGKIVL